MALIWVGVMGLVLTVLLGSLLGGALQWAVAICLGGLVVFAAWQWWQIDQSHLGSTPAELAEVTRLLAQDQLTQVQATLARGGQGVLGDLATVVGNLQNAKVNHDERSWRDQGLALIHDTVRHDYTPKALSDKVSQTLTRFLGLSACAVYVLEADTSPRRLHANSTLLRQSSSSGQHLVLPESLTCGYASLQALAASKTILRNAEVPHALSQSLSHTGSGDLVLVPLVIEDQVRGVLLMTAFQALPTQLEALMEPVSAAIAVAMQSAIARDTLQASVPTI
jgi:hypothetical protein